MRDSRVHTVSVTQRLWILTTRRTMRGKIGKKLSSASHPDLDKH